MSTVTQTLHEGRFLRLLRRDRWEFVQRVHSRGAAFVIATTADHELILVEQYRYPLDARCIELPAGIIGDSVALAEETVEQSALRELEEETGYRAQHAQLALVGPTAPGMTVEMSYFVRTGAVQRVGAGGGVDDEDIRVHLVPLAEVDRYLQAQQQQGLFVDPRIYTALHLLQRADPA